MAHAYIDASDEEPILNSSEISTTNTDRNEVHHLRFVVPNSEEGLFRIPVHIGGEGNDLQPTELDEFGASATQDPPAQPIRKYVSKYNSCQPCTTGEALFLLLQLIVIIESGFCIGLSYYSREAQDGECLLSADYRDAGEMYYGKSKYWCDLPIYKSFLVGSLAFLLIMMNWTAQLYANLKWLKIQVAVSVIALVSSLLIGCMVSAGFILWCDHLTASVHCTTNSTECNLQRQSIRRCLPSARYFDDHWTKLEMMEDVYLYTTPIVIISVVDALLWMGMTVLAVSRFTSYRPEEIDD